MNSQIVHDYLLEHWRTVVVYMALAVVLASLLLWRLGALPGGYSASEVQAYATALHPSQLLNNPINAPFYLVAKLLTYVRPHSYSVVRATSVLFGSIVLVLFAAVLHYWQGMRTAIIGTLLFGVSAWFLHTARLGTPDVMYFGVFALVASGFWLKQTQSSLAIVVYFLTTILLLYVPGMIWFILVGVAWQWRELDNAFRKHLVTVSLAALLLVASLSPIGWALYKHHGLLLQLLALPHTLPTLSQFGTNFIRLLYDFFVHAPDSPATWLGTAPFLDVFSLAMLVLGSYLYLSHIRLSRMQLFCSILILTLILMALGSPITFSILIPSVYLAVAAGTAYLFDSWFAVFPFNPIARSIGWTLLSALIGLVCLYHLTHYFTGWPQATATQAVFTYTKPD